MNIVVRSITTSYTLNKATTILPLRSLVNRAVRLNRCSSRNPNPLQLVALAAAQRRQISFQSITGGLFDMSADRRRPTWSPFETVKMNTLRSILQNQVNNIDRAQLLVNNVVMPIPPGKAFIQHLKISRKEDLVLEGMTADQCKGTFRAEWVQDQRMKLPKEAPAERIILYVHGGAYIVGSPGTHRFLTWRVSKHSQARVLAVDYRLAPKHIFPLALQDVLSAYSFLINPPLSTQHKYRPDQIVFMGDSAGGGLVWSAMLYIRDHPDEFPMPAGVAGIAPWLDLTHSMPSFLDNGKWDYLPSETKDPKHVNKDRKFPYVKSNADLPNPYVSPLYAKEEPTKPICPMLIQIGEVERLRDENLYWAMERFKNSPVRLEVYEDMVHVYHLFVTSKSIAGRSYQHLGNFVREVTSGKPFEIGTRSIMIRNQRPAYPVEKLEDPLKYVRDGLEKKGQTLEDVAKWLDEADSTRKKGESPVVGG
ncbi:hypothetical protein SmJEL517_g03447 [Synchytrium microbalum]|uniref:Alpha/beta hydrolase fold-3 domain-containing protein n=1 Tax=Synchytrium microbalum TaxID=1806994 RepID=A0A507C1X2_9FUNG|nr:uncharacterized protein SmJEL517_g03447 [Synchytrium microbalum]TPX33702.1 hypothetical protein SmJEL517_g03447 [Synchytrium microbalum]